MLSFLGLRVCSAANPRKYSEALQEIRHFLSLKPFVELQETPFVLTITHGDYSLSLPKNVLFLHTAFHNLPVLTPEDLDFLEVCYESLMIIREYFPSLVSIQLVVEQDSKELRTFEERKQEEFNRRVNANLKTLSDKQEFLNEDIEDVIYLTVHHYNRKNKAAALKLLIARLTTHNLGPFSQEYIDILGRLQEEPDLKKGLTQLINKIKALQRQQSLGKENSLQASNLYPAPETPLKLPSLLFQLQESLSLPRICSLLGTVLQENHEKDFWSRLQSSVLLVTSRLLHDEYEEIGLHGAELGGLLQLYWERRGKRWEEGARKEVEQKIRELSLLGTGDKLSRGKMPLSRRFLS